MADGELLALGTYAQRMRGEVLFARAWLLCEGQCEYILLRYFAELLGIPLDAIGVSIIDFKNNGSAGTFVSLARSLGVPWMMLCDNDDGGKSAVREVAGRGVAPEELDTRVVLLPGAGCYLEKYLVDSGFETDLTAIVSELGGKLATKPGDSGFRDELCKLIKANKTECAQRLVERLRGRRAGKDIVPKALAEVLVSIQKVGGT